MLKKKMPDFVTSTLVLVAALSFCLSNRADAAAYRISMLEHTKVLSTRTIDTKKIDGASLLRHGNSSLSFELTDKFASCGVFIQPGKSGQADVMVSLIENRTHPADKPSPSMPVIMNSALLTDKPLAANDQTVYPGSAGSRQVTVEAPKLNRTCTVSVL